jgi:hypothetical protein
VADNPSAADARAPLPSREGEPMTPPAADGPVSFEQDIKPLFRSSDRESMSFAFDLWDVGDVRSNAAAILDRLEDGSMPCDGEWSAAEVDLFRRWIAAGSSD